MKTLRILVILISSAVLGVVGCAAEVDEPASQETPATPALTPEAKPIGPHTCVCPVGQLCCEDRYGTYCTGNNYCDPW